MGREVRKAFAILKQSFASFWLVEKWQHKFKCAAWVLCK